MKVKFFIKLSMLLLMVLSLISCAAKGPGLQIEPVDALNPADYELKIDGFHVILDASSSLAEPYNGCSEYEVSVERLTRINQMLPEMDMTSALRSFGHHLDISNKTTILQYGVEKYSTAGFQAGLDKVSKPGGTSPMPQAIAATNTDLDSMEGKIAVIIISDGEAIKPSAIDEAKKIKRKTW